MGTEKSTAVTDGDRINPGIAAHAQELGVEVAKLHDLKGADKVLEFASAEAIQIPDDVNKRILRKIDWVNDAGSALQQY
jgi:hypothetical protein